MPASQEPAHARSAVAQTRLNALLDAAVDPIVLIDSRGLITRFSAAAQRIFGYTEAEVLRRNVSMLMPEPYRSEHDGYVERYLKTSDAHIIGIGREVQAQRKDGSTFPIYLAVGEFEAEGEHGFVGILRDITARKQQEEQLRRSEENLRLIFEYAPTAILITEPRGHITSANPAACALLGHNAEELLQLRQSDLVVEEDRARAAALLRDSVAARGEAEFEARYRRRDGSEFHALTHASLARDAGGAPVLMISEIVDRSDLLEATREAEELRARLTHVGRIGTLGEMVSGIAHEVNQPLTAIANYASACRRMLASGRTGPEEMAATLEKISQQAERAGDVIRGLRSLLRRRDEVRQPLDCNQLVREVLRITEFELRQAGFRVQLHLAPQLPPVLGDGVQIQQVVLNLILNAYDAMNLAAKGDAIEISTGAGPDCVEIRVADSGPGIPQNVAEHLFEPFFTTKSQGIGLGLSICKSIIAAHGGSLKFSSNAWGGTTFHVKLPVAEPMP